MNLRFLFLAIVLFLQMNFFAQNVVGVHQIEKTTHENEYLIKTTVSGLKQVDIAKVIIVIDSIHQFKKSTNNAYFFDRKGEEVKFYIMGIPPSGEINIEFSVVLSESNDFNFPVKFQYSKNEEKNQLDLPEIKISNLPLLAEEKTNKQEQEKLLAEQKQKEEHEAKRIAEEKALQQKLEDEKLAKAEAEKQAKLEQEELLAEQQKEAQEAKRILEEKAKEEKLVQQKLEEERLAKNIARLNAEQEEKKKQAKLEQEKILAEKQQKEEAKDKVETNTSNLKTYSVQLLSLANYSEERLNSYCKKHNLAKDKIIKRQVGNLMKISYGKVNSQDEATTLQQKLKNEHQIDASFVVVLN